jgi:hypothetical protein
MGITGGPQTHKHNHKQLSLLFPVTCLFFSHLRSSQWFHLKGHLDKVQHLRFTHISPLSKILHLCRTVLLRILYPIPSLHSKEQDKFSHQIWHCDFVSLAIVYRTCKKYFSSYHISTWTLVFVIRWGTKETKFWSALSTYVGELTESTKALTQPYWYVSFTIH